MPSLLLIVAIRLVVLHRSGSSLLGPYSPSVRLCRLHPWTLIEEAWFLLGNKSGTTRPGFGVLLKYFELALDRHLDFDLASAA